MGTRFFAFFSIDGHPCRILPSFLTLATLSRLARLAALAIAYQGTVLVAKGKCSYHVLVILEVEACYGVFCGRQELSISAVVGYETYPAYPMIAIHRMHISLRAYADGGNAVLYLDRWRMLLAPLALNLWHYLTHNCTAAADRLTAVIERAYKIAAALTFKMLHFISPFCFCYRYF